MSTKEALDMSKLDRIFSVAGGPANALRQIGFSATFIELVGSMSGVLLEVRLVSRKYKRIGGNRPKSRNAGARA